MNTKAFRIGNHVLVDNKVVEVRAITQSKIGYYNVGDKPGAHLRYARYFEILPINIDENLLERLGFSKVEKGNEHQAS